MRSKNLPFACLSIWFFLSCSQGNLSTVDPIQSDSNMRIKEQSVSIQPRHLISFNIIRMNPADNDYEIIPVRLAETHFNVLKFLEVWPCTNCLKFLSITNSDHGTKLVDIGIQNPFSNANYTVFDVRGIAMFYGSRHFPVIAKTVPDATLGDGELINADGYTSLYHWGTQFYDTTGWQCYRKGKYATTLAPLAWFQGFKRFHSPDPSNTRNAFYHGATVVRTYDIDMPDTTFIFGYAVDASWANPTVNPVVNPMTDFPPQANSPEPWRLDVNAVPVGYGLTNEGGQVELYIDVYDYPGFSNYALPVVECPALFDGAKTASFAYEGLPGMKGYMVLVANTKLAPVGKYKCLIKVVDNANASSPEWLDLTAYHVYTLEVKEQPHGWVRVWGGTDFETGYDIATDSANNVYSVGTFMQTVDFDPGPGVDSRSSAGIWDCYLVKYDSKGVYKWAKTWGGIDSDSPGGVVVDGLGNIYVCGAFRNSVDFDPGPGTNIATVVGGSDAFLLKLNSAGGFQWVRTWGGIEGDAASKVAIGQLNQVYVVGAFRGSADFNPGAGEDIHVAINNASFVCRYQPDGVYVWGRSWEGGHYGGAYGVAIDSLDGIYVCGDFSGYVDFDPGPGEDVQIGVFNAFLSKFNNAGVYQWARTWGSGVNNAWDYGNDVAIDLDGGVWVTGSFEGTCDFDPGPNVENRSTNGIYCDLYLTKFDPGGNFMTVSTWGGPYLDDGRSLATAGMHEVYLFGVMSASEQWGLTHIFLQKYGLAGLEWTRTWGKHTEPFPNAGWAVAADASGNAYFTSTFVTNIDFNPSPTEEEFHSPVGWGDSFICKVLPNGLW